MTKQERINAAYDYLIRTQVITKQEDLAKIMETKVANISSALKGNEKYLTNGFIIRFHEKTSFAFSLEWLLYERGEMLTRPYEKTSEEVKPMPRWADALVQLVAENTKILESLRSEYQTLVSKINQLLEPSVMMVSENHPKQ